MSSNRYCRSRFQQGIALVIVLWLLVLLSMIALHLSATSRTVTRISSNFVDGTQARYAADAGVQWAIWNLSLPEAQRWLADGSFQQMQLDRVTVSVSLQDENGKFNINAMTLAQLLALFAAAGIDEATASSLSDKILDWRDSDDLRRLNGAEDEDYLAAGFGYEVADGLFKSVEELRKIMGMEEWIYQLISPALSTKARNQGVNPWVASRLVLLAMPGATETLVDQYIEQRRSDYEAGLTAKAPLLPTASFVPVNTPGVYYTIEITSTLEEGAGFRQKVQLVRSGAGDKASYNILSVIDIAEPPLPDCSAQECPEEG